MGQTAIKRPRIERVMTSNLADSLWLVLGVWCRRRGRVEVEQVDVDRLSWRSAQRPRRVQ